MSHSHCCGVSGPSISQCFDLSHCVRSICRSKDAGGGNSTFEQVSVSEAVVGDAKNFLLENQELQIALNDGNPLYVELPASVVLELTYTEPGLQGDRSTGGTKPATLETGYEIQVPLFLETGTKVR